MKNTLIIKVSHEVNHEWDLAKSRAGSAGAVAKEAGLPLEKFLRLLTRGALKPKPLQETEGAKVPRGFKVTPGDDKAVWDRIERVALFDETTAELSIWRAICSWVEGAEEDMIIHPKTGRPIGRVCEVHAAMTLRLTRAGARAERARIATNAANPN